jgi:hypothetical protein
MRCQMSEKWYYVLSGERQGPVPFEQVQSLYQEKALNDEDYVWTKSFENWVKIKDVKELQIKSVAKTNSTPGPKSALTKIDLLKYSNDEKAIYIKTGADRGQAEVEYGPFSIELLKRLYNEKRINGQTFIFAQGMKNWSVLADAIGFEEVFEDVPPTIEDENKRSFKRKPFIARMFIQNNQKVFEGICRDVSIGGMQVLVDHFPGRVGETISINVHPENTDHHFVASGQIVRLLEGGHGFSFRFKNLTTEAQKAIQSYIEKES